MSFRLRILSSARTDIQESIRWYNQRQAGLGRRFHAELKEFLDLLSKNPMFENRYDEVRCIPMRKFPFMVHFTVDESALEVVIHGVFHTSLNPKVWRR